MAPFDTHDSNLSSYDSGFDVRRSREGELLVTADVKDKDGHPIVEINENHWKVSPSKNVCWDKNYTKNALEVLDGRQHVVLQLEILADRVRVRDGNER